MFYAVLLLSISVFSQSQRTICETDDRVVSQEREIGRLKGKGSCTGSLIGRSCFLTAGHCKEPGYVEFNTRLSWGRKPTPSDPKDVYEVSETIVHEFDRRTGFEWRDYAVHKLKKNKLTGQFPGDVQGSLNVSFEPPGKNLRVRITGYGVDYSEAHKHLAQQTHTGVVTKIEENRLFYVADTMGGNSGGPVVDTSTGLVVGIHTRGGCGHPDYMANSGTLISAIPELQQAILSCLESE